MLDLTLPILLLLKPNTGTIPFFAHDVMLQYVSVTFKFWVTLDCFRGHGKRQIKNLDFGVEHKPNGRTCQFQYQ